MSISFDNSILEKFEDIIEDTSPEVGTVQIDQPQRSSYPSAARHHPDADSDDDDIEIPTLDANSLTLKDLLHEMEKRGLHARGFFEDDAKILQAELDREHDEYIESKCRIKQEAKQIEATQRLLQRRKALTENAMREENEELRKNKRMAEWFRLIQREQDHRSRPSDRPGTRIPQRCRIDVNDVSARSLARLLWSDERIISLDVSGLSLSDASGAYLARVLRNNKTMAKLEMGDNRLGPKTCSTLAESLRDNKTLRFLSIESNLLEPKTANTSSKISAAALADVVRSNTSLRHLSIWRCNIGTDGGRMIAEAMPSNETLTCIELGHNFWENGDIVTIKNCLSRNQEIRRKEEEHEREIDKQKREDMEEKRILQEQKLKEEVDNQWLKEQKLERSEERRQKLDQQLERIRTQEVERERELERLRLEEEKISKRRKKNKKKKRKVRGVLPR